jgi:serine/threonine-protein kinase
MTFMGALSAQHIGTKTWHPETQTPMREIGVGGNYRLGSRLDDGGTNELYEAVHPGYPGRVVLKLLRRALQAGPEKSEACRREASLVARLAHPNIAGVVALGTMPDGVPLVVREYLQGETLQALLSRRGRLSLTEVVSIVNGVAAGLAAAHGAKVIHGDLRPNRVFLEEAAGYVGGFVKILDFGIWRLAGERRGPGAQADVARFIAPELLGDGKQKVDGGADQFALAAMAYRMIAGVDAFPGDDVAAVLRGVERGNVASLTAVAACDSAVDVVIRRGLANNPADRFGTVLGFAAALEKAAATVKPEITQNVTSSQLMAATPLQLAKTLAAAPRPGAQPQQTLDDDVSESFFAEGERQEQQALRQGLEEGESIRWPSPRYQGSLHARRRRGPLLFALAVLVCAGVGVAWWSGWRPPAELSSIVASVAELAKR